MHDPSLPHEQGYISVAKARDDRAKARDVVVAELQRVQGALRRALSLADALGLRRQVEDLLGRAESLSSLLDTNIDEALAA